MKTFILILTLALSFNPIQAQNNQTSLAFKNQRQHQRVPLFYPTDLDYHLWDKLQLVQKANNGDAVAQHELGIRYLLGEGFPVDTVMSVSWIKKSAAQNLIPAKYNYAIFLNNGWGTEWNPFEAFTNFYYAAENGMTEAEFIVGLFYTENLILKRNWDSSYFWIKKAADKKLPAAIEILSQIIEIKEKHKNKVELENENSSLSLVYIDFSSDSLPKVEDETVINEAIKVLQSDSNLSFSKPNDVLLNDSLFINNLIENSEAGNPESLTLLGLINEKGYGVEIDKIKAAAFYIRAYRLESPRAGILLWNLIQEKNFYTVLRNKIFSGNKEAKFIWGMLFALGLENSITNQQAIQFLTESANGNYIPAIVELGYLYYTGKIVEKNIEKGILYWFTAAQLGNIEAEIRIAMSSLLEKKSNELLSTAVQTLNKGLIKGSVLAQSALGFCYRYGISVTQNKGEAVKLYREAAQRGNQFAYRELQSIYNELRPDEEKFKITNN